MKFRGASADALATLSGELDGAVASADAGAVGADLFSVSSVLRAEPGLRRVATDVSVSGEAKAGLMRQIFEGKVGDAALRLVSTAVGQRWAATRDLADVLEHLGVVATVKSSGGDSGRLADELFELGRTVNANPDLRDALSDPARSVEDKRGLVRGLLEGRALPSTNALAEQALYGSHRTVGVALHESSRSLPRCTARGWPPSGWPGPCPTPTAGAWPRPSTGSTTARCTSTWSSTPRSSAASVSRSVTTSSTARSPAGSTTPGASWPSDQRTPTQGKEE
jgi:F-type H+-transporting ATPase subunit delta